MVTVDDVCGDASSGGAAVVDAVEVVVAQVGVEVAFEAGVADVEVAGEGGAPALFEDRAVQPFDVSVGLRTSGADLGDASAERGSGRAEPLVAELVAAVDEQPLESPAGS